MTTVSSGPATAGEKELKTDWPEDTGLEVGTTKQEGREINLVPEKSTILCKEKEGLD